MDPWRLMLILEESDPSFRALLFPVHLRCPLEKRIMHAIEEHWPVYHPTRKECRGKSWSISIPPSEPLYQPQPGTVRELNIWKAKIQGTIAQGRAHRSNRSWKSFATICQDSPGLRPFLTDFKPLLDFLIFEESMWPRRGGVGVGIKEHFEAERSALFGRNSPYRFAEPKRLRFIRSNQPSMEKSLMISAMRSLFDRPLMILAILQVCADKSGGHFPWLDLRDYVRAIIRTPEPCTFRRLWFDHAMKSTESVKKSGDACARQWARRLVAGIDMDPGEVEEDAVTKKAIEVNSWLKMKKRPSVDGIKRCWRAVVAAKGFQREDANLGWGRWYFSWMLTIWLEKHFEEVLAEFKGNLDEVRGYYRRFFHYLEIANDERAGGFCPRQP